MYNYNEDEIGSGLQEDVQLFDIAPRALVEPKQRGIETPRRSLESESGNSQKRRTLQVRNRVSTHETGPKNLFNSIAEEGKMVSQDSSITKE